MSKYKLCTETEGNLIILWEIIALVFSMYLIYKWNYFLTGIMFLAVLLAEYARQISMGKV